MQKYRFIHQFHVHVCATVHAAARMRTTKIEFNVLGTSVRWSECTSIFSNGKNKSVAIGQLAFMRWLRSVLRMNYNRTRVFAFRADCDFCARARTHDEWQSIAQLGTEKIVFHHFNLLPKRSFRVRAYFSFPFLFLFLSFSPECPKSLRGTLAMLSARPSALRKQ